MLIIYLLLVQMLPIQHKDEMNKQVYEMLLPSNNSQCVTQHPNDLDVVCSDMMPCGCSVAISAHVEMAKQ